MSKSDEKPAMAECVHDLVVVLNRQWCVRPYDENGCGGFWRRRNAESPWVRDDVLSGRAP